ncbi:hypothetical protein DSUL_60304 [Desulfovibrionales bacterium]
MKVWRFNATDFLYCAAVFFFMRQLAVLAIRHSCRYHLILFSLVYPLPSLIITV